MKKYNKKQEVEKSEYLAEENEIEQALVLLDNVVDLDKSARQSGALIRHRGVHSAMELLRVVLAYSVLDYSLRLLGIWCVLLGISSISKTAWLKRLCQCRQWLGMLVVAVLQKKGIEFARQEQVRIRLIDATVVCPPGSKGNGWRLHTGFDLGRMSMDWIELTNTYAGESLSRFSFQAGDICIADRGYSTKNNVKHVLKAGAWLLVRLNRR